MVKIIGIGEVKNATASFKSRACHFFIVSIFVFLLPFKSSGQERALRSEIQTISHSIKGITGVALIGLPGSDTITYEGNRKLPMQSVFKFPLAMMVLDQVDKGKFTIDQKIHIDKKDLLPDTWSPLRTKYPQGNVDLPLSEIIGYTVSQSDNVGCDLLFRLVGGTEKVNAYVHSLGINDIAIVGTEEQMHKDWNVQYTNYSTPIAMAQLLQIFYNGKSLSKTSNDFLWKLMVETTTGPDKIKGMLPAGTVVAHKTGASGTNDKGLIGAANDAGIVALPNGRYFIIVVFVSDTTNTADDCARVIARISKAAMEYFSFR